MAWQTAVRKIPGGNAGNLETLRAMRALASKGAVSPVVIEAAQNAVRGTPERDDDVDFAAVLRDVRRRMRYTHDPLDAEVVKDPAFVIERTNDPESSPEPMDCDDASTLCASMLGALGYATKFVTVAADPSRPSDWSHVYVTARRNNGRWVALDPIVRQFGVGDEVPRSRISDRAEHEGARTMSRLGCYGRPCGRLAGFAGMGDAALDAQRLTAYQQGGVWDPSWGATPGTAAPAATGTSWWERLFDSAGTAAAKYVAAKKGPARIVVNQAGPSAPGFFSNPDGTTNWLKVGLVGAGVVVGGTLVAKLAKGR